MLEVMNDEPISMDCVFKELYKKKYLDFNYEYLMARMVNLIKEGLVELVEWPDNKYFMIVRKK